MNGDVDILITRRDGKRDPNFMLDLVKHLYSVDKLLSDHLIMPKISPHGTETYMGICKIDSYPLHRRLDLKFYPRE